MTTHCDLCEAARMTTWYHEDEVCWVADCEVCDTPMVVWQRHGAEPSDDEVEHMLSALGAPGPTMHVPDCALIRQSTLSTSL